MTNFYEGVSKSAVCEGYENGKPTNTKISIRCADCAFRCSMLDWDPSTQRSFDRPACKETKAYVEFNGEGCAVDCPGAEPKSEAVQQ